MHASFYSNAPILLSWISQVRDELEHLLDDDNDMAEMYLTQKLAGRSMDHASILKEETIEEDNERCPLLS